MPKLPDLHVIALNTTIRLVVAEEGLGKIINYIDAEGDETTDVAEAEYAIVEWQFGGYSNLKLEEYEVRKLM